MASTSSASSTPKNIHGKVIWPESPSIKQEFAFPDSIIYYLLKNTSYPNIYLKLTQSCKYFFEQNQVVVAARIHEDKTETIMCLNDKEICQEKEEECCLDADIPEIKCKIWLTDELKLSYNNISKCTSLLLPKLYQCECAELVLCCNIATFDDFKKLAAAFKKFVIFDLKITNSDGSIVMLDSILEACSNVESFDYWFVRGTDAATASTLMDMSKLQNLKNLKHLELNDIPEIFDVEDIFSFAKTHINATMMFDFHWSISEEYKTQLDSVIDRIIELPNLRCCISYEGQNEEKLEILEIRCGL
uniref:DUF38 domain-containing protein n=1 Tax=Panagrolaimus sp. ES5 TaxID=591445 RepID=A0AC34FMM8_9BILA